MPNDFLREIAMTEHLRLKGAAYASPFFLVLFGLRGPSMGFGQTDQGSDTRSRCLQAARSTCALRSIHPEAICYPPLLSWQEN